MGEFAAGSIQSRMAAWLIKCGVTKVKADKIAENGKIDKGEFEEINPNVDSVRISSQFRDLMDKSMDASAAEGDGVIDEKEFNKMDSTLTLYADVFGLSYDEALKAYGNAKGFENADLQAMKDSRATVATTAGLKEGMTVDEMSKILNSKGVNKNIVKNIELYATKTLKLGGGTKLEGENYAKVIARVSAMAGIAKMDLIDQKEIFGIDIAGYPLPAFEGPFTQDNILIYLGLKEKALIQEQGGISVPGLGDFLAATYEADGATRKKDVSPSKYNEEMGKFMVKLDARATELKTKATSGTLTQEEAKEFLKIVAYQADFSLYSTDNKAVTDNLTFMLEQIAKFDKEAVNGLVKAYTGKINGFLSQEGDKPIITVEELKNLKSLVVAYNKAMGDTKGIPAGTSDYVTEDIVDTKITRVIRVADLNKDGKLSDSESSAQHVAFLGTCMLKDDSEGKPIPADEIKTNKEIAFLLSIRLNGLCLKNKANWAQFPKDIGMETPSIKEFFKKYDDAVKFVDEQVIKFVYGA